MRQKPINYLKLRILLLGIPLLFLTCIKDDTISEIESSKKSPINITIESYEHLKSQNQRLASKVDKYIQSQYLYRSSTSQEYGFTINDNNVQVMEMEHYTTYTFLVFREETEPNLLENYVYKENDDGTYQQFLLGFSYYTDEDGNRVYSTSTMSIQSIEDDGLLMNRSGCSPEFVEAYGDTTCTYHPYCWGPGADGGHEIGDSQCRCQQSVMTCYPAGSTACGTETIYVYKSCPGGTADYTYTGDGTNPSGGQGGNSNEDDNDLPNDDDDIIAVPFEDLTEKQVQKECQKISNFLNAPENAAFKQKLLDLANPTNYAENLDIEFEKSITKHQNYVQLQEREGVTGAASVDISYTLTQANKTNAWVHTHPNDSTGTYSVFSFDDLIGISKMLANDKLDTGTFVAFLITKKGNNLTCYAMTINNKAKFQDFFYAYQEFNILTATQEEKDKRTVADKKSNQIRTKYYEHKTSPLISHYNINNQQMLTQFLKFMQETDLGATLFATDENFSDFIRVSYDNTIITGGIKEQTCND